MQLLPTRPRLPSLRIGIPENIETQLIAGSGTTTEIVAATVMEIDAVSAIGTTIVPVESDVTRVLIEAAEALLLM
jgi:hypothetical protein